MKNSMVRTSVAIIFLVIMCISGCKDQGPAEQEKVEALLVSTEWNDPVVTVDGVDQSDLYQNFAIKFIKGTYTSSEGSPLWPNAGTWIFKDETASAIILDSKMEVQINEITETSLELAVQNNNTTFISGRINSLKGKNIFRLKSK